MTSRQKYLAERKQAAANLADFNDRACAHFAAVLRDNVRLCREVGLPPADLIPVAYFEAVYKLLCFAPLADRAVLILGKPDDIEALVSKTQTAKGFYSETGHWIEL
jgi:hypothetical protein